MHQATCPEGRTPIVVTWLESYKPSGVEAALWASVRPLVLRAAQTLELNAGAASVRTVRVLCRLAVWAIGEGLPLDFEVLLDPATVERFTSVGQLGDPSAATYRSLLRRVGPVLTRHAGWEPRSQSVGRRQVAVPYTEQDLSGLSADAAAQPTPGRRRAAAALLALGCGAGLDGRWVARVTSEDVVASAWGVLVRVGEPSARVVPVLQRWESEVLELAATAGNEFLIGGHSVARNRAGALAASLLVAHGRPRFSASRLRSTWLVTHLSMGTRLPELARAAGLAGVTVLSDLLEYVPPLDDHESTAVLRGRA